MMSRSDSGQCEDVKKTELTVNSSTLLRMFAVSQPGLEQVTALELKQLGLKCHVEQGGVSFQGSIRDLYLANLWLRTANRVLVRVGNFRIQDLSRLAARFARYPWELYGLSRNAVANHLGIRITCRKSKLYHTGAVAQRALQGIERRLGQPCIPSVKAEDVLVIARIVRDRCVVSIDSSGRPLHMRGYRIKGVKAPLRENLAAGLLLISGWDSSRPLLDPFCGSGTIAIEAAMISAGIPPGANRDFAFMRWKNFDPDLWHSLHDQSISNKLRQDTKIYAWDCDENAIKAAMENARAAGVSKRIRFSKITFRAETRPPDAPQGWLVTNPPYGKRLSGRYCRTDNIYAELAHGIKNNFQNWGFTCLVPANRKKPCPGIPLRSLTSFFNGGLKVHIIQKQPLSSLQPPCIQE